MAERLLKPEEAMKYFPKSKRWFAEDRKKDNPTVPFVRLGKHVFYRESDIQDVIEQSVVGVRRCQFRDDSSFITIEQQISDGEV